VEQLKKKRYIQRYHDLKGGGHEEKEPQGIQE
jgi:hypothetical protein